MIDHTRKSDFTDKLSEEIDKNEAGIYAIGHNSEEEREETRRLFREHKEAYDKYGR